MSEEKYRVLIVHNRYQIPGGEDTVVANEKKLLEDHGHEVILYTRDNNELRTMKPWRKLLLPFTTIYNPRTARDIKRIIREERVDIVHVHNTLNLISPAVYYAALKCGVPVVQTIHNFRMLCPGATFYRDGHICEDCVTKGLCCAVKHGCYRGSKAQTLVCVISTLIHRRTGIYGKINYIALTEFNRDKLLQLKQIRPERVFVKPNFTFEALKTKSVCDDSGYYLYIGRLEEIKGVPLMLKAFSRMPNKQLRLAGTGTEIERYKKCASENVAFLGFLNRSQLTQQFAGCKAVIVASQWYETFGMIVVEAYAAHRPVIVGDIGNVGGLVEAGITGVKYKYDSVEALIDAIDQIEDGMGDKGYEKYNREFSPNSNYKQLMNIYERVLSCKETVE